MHDSVQIDCSNRRQAGCIFTLSAAESPTIRGFAAGDGGAERGHPEEVLAIPPEFYFKWDCRSAQRERLDGMAALMAM